MESDTPNMTAAVVAVALLCCSPAHAGKLCGLDDYPDQRSDWTELAAKTPGEVRDCMLAYWRQRKTDAEISMGWARENLKKAEDGIQVWTTK